MGYYIIAFGILVILKIHIAFLRILLSDRFTISTFHSWDSIENHHLNLPSNTLQKGKPSQAFINCVTHVKYVISLGQVHFFNGD